MSRQQQEQIALEDTTPVEQRDALTLQEALELCPNDGPRPLTIEYRAATTTKGKEKQEQSANQAPSAETTAEGPACNVNI